MKRFFFLVLTASLSLIPALARAQEDADSTGLPGDNFDLQGALELFKNSASPEAFEKALNTESNDVNNLDLNGDSNIDYIRVTDRADGKSHAVVMQVAVNKNELQDIAVIVIEQTGEAQAQLQIIGDKELYGEEKIVEPFDEVADKATHGPSSMIYPAHMVIVNVWSWPCVHYMYTPSYVVYLSPWGWEYYPVWWHPWRPVYWHHYHRRVRRYHMHYYHYAPSCHLKSAQNVYMGHRATSKTVTAKYAGPRANYQQRKERGEVRQPVKEKAVQPTSRPTKENSVPVERKEQPARPVENSKPVDRQSTPAERKAEPERKPNRTAEPQRTPNRTSEPRVRQPQQQRQATPQRQPQQNRNMGNPRPQQRQSAPRQSAPRRR